MKSFVATSHAVRIHAGPGALDALPAEVGRTGAQRAFVLCGRSVGADEVFMGRLRGLLGPRWAGHYDGIGKDAPLRDVLQAVSAVRASAADMLVAVGAGSVLKAARVVAILLAEQAPLEELVTRYPDGGAPVSPRLAAPKLPIVNILTAATSAQNRAGAALKNEPGGYRLEFFDPKTRPRAIFWDPQALATAPPAFALSTGVSVYWRALMNMGAYDQANPLVQASRRQAHDLARQAITRLTDPADGQARIDMCAAALLQNRDEDDGGRPFEAHWIAQAVYALAAAAFNLVEQAGQAQTHAVLTGPAIRAFGPLCPDAALAIGAALGVVAPAADAAQGIIQAAAAADTFFRGLGMPARLRDMGIAQARLAEIRQLSLKNFNADRARRLGAHQDLLDAVLAQAW
jgi:alcohol dehydrogenase class IV